VKKKFKPKINFKEIERKFPRANCSNEFYQDIHDLLDLCKFQRNKIKELKKAYGKLFNKYCELESECKVDLKILHKKARKVKK
jgi:hypothetical protein